MAAAAPTVVTIQFDDGTADASDALAILQAAYVTGAEQHGGGWVQLVFHHLCNRCTTYSITAADLTGLLDWLQARSGTGTVVLTTNDGVGGQVKPVVPG